MLNKYSKTTPGFVTQTFERDEQGKWKCTGQNFYTGNPVEYENEKGEQIDFPEDEIYQPYDMIIGNLQEIKDLILNEISSMKITSTINIKDLIEQHFKALAGS